MKTLSLDQFTGYLAIGTLVITAIAAIFQAFMDLKPYTEWMVSTQVWNVFISVPLLIVSYLVGIIVVHLSSFMFDKFREDTATKKINRLFEVGTINNDLVAERYQKLIQELEILQAACPTMGLLGLGLLLNILTTEVNFIDTLLPKKVLFFCSLAALLFACIPLFLFLVSHTYKEIVELSSKIRNFKSTGIVKSQAKQK